MFLFPGIEDIETSYSHLQREFRAIQITCDTIRGGCDIVAVSPFELFIAICFEKIKMIHEQGVGVGLPVSSNTTCKGVKNRQKNVMYSLNATSYDSIIGSSPGL